MRRSFVRMAGFILFAGLANFALTYAYAALLGPDVAPTVAMFSGVLLGNGAVLAAMATDRQWGAW